MKTPLLFLAALSCLPAATVNHDYRAEINQWRQRREAALKADGGWLTVTGLFWLKQGENTLGSDASSDILLPETSQAHFGTVFVDGGKIRFTSADANVRLNGQPVQEAELHIGAGEKQDILSTAAIQLLPIKRGDRLALRLKDTNSKLRSSFVGLKWYPVDEAWRITGTFVPFSAPTKLTFETVIGETEVMDSPGYVTFERAGQTYKLQAAGQGKRLFFVIRDQTSGKSTYGLRFLYSEVGADGSVVLDFNKAENPPCAFTPYATCPLPPPQNRLSFAVTAGELNYEGGGH